MVPESGFTALVLDETDEGVIAAVKRLDDSELPDGDVTVDVAYSTLNYKDGMIVKGIGRMVRDYPHVPGIDFCGTVRSSESDKFKPGDPVILNGWRVGEVRWGGFATKTRVQADWLVPVPDGLSLQQCMAIGTAGYTAMLALMALEDHGLTPEAKGEVLITGAAGGVGSIAVALLANLGYRVAAATGRAETHDYLTDLGATVIVERAELETPPRGPLASERWSAIIDNVGGDSLGNILAALAYWGSCISVGNAGGIKFTATVIPFLLRGINLLGIDSGTCPIERRIVAWNRLAKQLPLDKLEKISTVEPLARLPELADDILGGRVRGRTVIDVRA